MIGHSTWRVSKQHRAHRTTSVLQHRPGGDDAAILTTLNIGISDCVTDRAVVEIEKYLTANTFVLVVLLLLGCRDAGGGVAGVRGVRRSARRRRLALVHCRAGLRGRVLLPVLLIPVQSHQRSACAIEAN
jgi:hypothetical protein